MKESHIEQMVCQFAKDRGWLALKLNIIGVIGFPDRMFLKRPGRVLFMEFKAPGKTLRKAQVNIHLQLKDLGFEVYTIDDIDAGQKIITKRSAPVPS